jgi:WNK lysine deficient protein kinase
VLHLLTLYCCLLLLPSSSLDPPCLPQGIQPAGLDKVKNEELREFIRLCIGHDPGTRPEARQLLKHPFFESMRTGKAAAPAAAPERSEEAPLERSRSPSSADDDEEDPSPQMHATQVINLQEMAQLSRQADEEAAAAAATAAAAGASAEQQDHAAAVPAAASAAAAGVDRGAAAPTSAQLAAAGDMGVIQQPAGAEQQQQQQQVRAPSDAGSAPGQAQSPETGGGLSEEEDLDEAGAADGRSLCVNCHEEEEHKLSFFLKFVEPEGGLMLRFTMQQQQQ